MKCGRQPEGEKVDELGVCPAAVPSEYDGVNGGALSGRFCWAIAGTLGGGKKHGKCCSKLKDCLHCEFMDLVRYQQGRNCVFTPASQSLNPAACSQNKTGSA